MKAQVRKSESEKKEALKNLEKRDSDVKKKENEIEELQKELKSLREEESGKVDKSLAVERNDIVHQVAYNGNNSQALVKEVFFSTPPTSNSFFQKIHRYLIKNLINNQNKQIRL